MNTGNFDLDALSNGVAYGRYFGKDLTNLEHQQFHLRESSHQIKSTLKSSGREIKGKQMGKPTPIQFYKEIFKNQRLLHKRSQTNDANRSGSVDLQEINKSKGQIDSKENLHLLPKGETQKAPLTKFLKVKSRIAAYLPQDQKPENQIVIQEFQEEKNSENNFDFKANKDHKQENYSGKFQSIPTLIPAALQKSKFIGLSKQTPTGQSQATKFQNSDFQKQEKPRPDRSNKNFQYLRLNLDEGSKFSPRKESMDKESPKKSESKDGIENELEQIEELDRQKILFRQFDIPFMWDYLLLQEVRTIHKEKHV